MPRTVALTEHLTFHINSILVQSPSSDKTMDFPVKFKTLLNSVAETHGTLYLHLHLIIAERNILV